MSPRAARPKSAPVEAPQHEPTHEEIAARAYEIHESGAGGDQLQDWLRAEQELTAAAA